MINIKRFISLLARLCSRYPGVLALVGFVSGVASFLLVEREQDKFAQLVSMLMLGGWLLLMLENLLKRGVSQWFGTELPDPVVRFVTQMVHQESLFFVIPFFFITTAWNSGQAVFTALLMLMAAVSIIDPIYYNWLAPRRWVYFFYHGITLFAVLLTTLPIVFHIPTAETYLWSLIAAAVLSFLNMVRDWSTGWGRRVVLALVLIAVAGAAGLLGRPWVPPATLWLTRVAISTQIDDRTKAPVGRLTRIAEADIHRGLYAYTAIHAPRGLHERVFHIWRLNGNVIDKIALEIEGGRRAGYRAWSHKLNFPEKSTGQWRIDVVTQANQVIGVLRFSVLEEVTAANTRLSNTHRKNDNLEPGKPIIETMEEKTRQLIDSATDEAP